MGDTNQVATLIMSRQAQALLVVLVALAAGRKKIAEYFCAYFTWEENVIVENLDLAFKLTSKIPDCRFY